MVRLGRLVVRLVEARLVPLALPCRLLDPLVPEGRGVGQQHLVLAGVQVQLHAEGEPHELKAGFRAVVSRHLVAGLDPLLALCLCLSLSLSTSLPSLFSLCTYIYIHIEYIHIYIYVHTYICVLFFKLLGPKDSREFMFQPRLNATNRGCGELHTKSINQALQSPRVDLHPFVPLNPNCAFLRTHIKAFLAVALHLDWLRALGSRV